MQTFLTGQTWLESLFNTYNSLMRYNAQDQLHISILLSLGRAKFILLCRGKEYILHYMYYPVRGIDGGHNFRTVNIGAIIFDFDINIMP